MLVSSIGTPYNPATGEGQVGKNYAYQMTSGVNRFFDDKVFNPFIGAGALGMCIDEFNGDNFDHTGLGFMKPREVNARRQQGHYSIVPYQTTHNTGGTIMGSNPRENVVNKYLQSWDISNLFIMGSGTFPQNPSYNPTGTVAALAYHSAAAIRQQYLRNPGPLVPA